MRMDYELSWMQMKPATTIMASQWTSSSKRHWTSNDDSVVGLCKNRYHLHNSRWKMVPTKRPLDMPHRLQTTNEKSRSIFCLPHRLKFSHFFDLCLHWVSVVRDWNNIRCVMKNSLNRLYNKQCLNIVNDIYKLCQWL